LEAYKKYGPIVLFPTTTFRRLVHRKSGQEASPLQRREEWLLIMLAQYSRQPQFLSVWSRVFMPQIQGYGRERTPTLSHLFLKALDVLCRLPKAMWRIISHAILIMIPVAGQPAPGPAAAQQDVPAPEIRHQLKVLGGYEFAVEFL
jgi:hypothetical protein